MKISIGMRLQEGAWGGGNQFGNALVKYFQKKGVDICFDLHASDIDLILLTEPRKGLRISAYNDVDIVKYLLKNKDTLVVHRINECDERKGTHDVNQRLLRANLCADHTVFVSSWLRELFTTKGWNGRVSSIIVNGSDREVFHSKGNMPWPGASEPMRLVTHHWGASWLKGFDIYQCFDDMLGSPAYRDRFSFTYIGNLPKGFEFKNTTYIPPKYGIELADLLRQHHVYLTASQNEPGGNHQNEGANCGLPLLFRESGCLPEYCMGYGVSFINQDNFGQKLEEMVNTYNIWVDKMKDFPNTADHMSKQYYELFLSILNSRSEILARRKRSARFIWLIKTLLAKK